MIYAIAIGWLAAALFGVKFMMFNSKCRRYEKDQLELDYQARKFDIHEMEALWRVK